MVNNEKMLLAAAMRAGRIDSVSKLRKFPNLDASLIRLIIGPINIKSKIYSYSPIDVNVCRKNDCSTWKAIQAEKILPDHLADPDPEGVLMRELRISECMKMCEKCPYANSEPVATYINPRKKYNLYNISRSIIDKLGNKEIRFSKLIIKTMIVLQCWPSEIVIRSGDSGSDGTLPGVYTPDLARILNCNVNFLEDCLFNLGNLGLIQLDKQAPHVYDITIPNYYLKYEKASKGGVGYIQIDRSILEKIISEKNIIALRGMLLQLLSNPFASRTDAPNSIALDEFKQVMPKYVNYKTLYNTALENTLFTAVYDKFKCSFIYIPKSNYKSVAEQKTEILQTHVRYLGKGIKALKPTFVTVQNTRQQDPDYNRSVNKVINDYKGDIPQEILSSKPLLSFMKDALIVSIEYGLKNVLDAIKQLEINYRLYGNKINNAGALLRYHCCHNMLNDYA